jgi:hypothetical protein
MTGRLNHCAQVGQHAHSERRRNHVGPTTIDRISWTRHS